MRRKASSPKKEVDKVGLHNELVLAIIGLGVLGIGAMIDWAEQKVKKYIKSRKARH